MLLRSRADAGLRPPRGVLPAAPLLRNRLFLHHTVTAPTDDPNADWRTVQNIAFGRGFDDISYTYGVHPYGVCLEGRSPRTVGAHTKGYNSSAHAIVLIGNYQDVDPPPQMIDAVRWLRHHLVGQGVLTAGHRFDPHRSVSATACPGNRVVNRFAEFAAPWSPPAPEPQPEPDPDPEFRRKVSMLPTLRPGSTGHYVKNLQALLIAHAEDLVIHVNRGTTNGWVDGQFGPGTEWALAAWQDRTGVLNQRERGFCGPETWAWLVGV